MALVISDCIVVGYGPDGVYDTNAEYDNGTCTSQKVPTAGNVEDALGECGGACADYNKTGCATMQRSTAYKRIPATTT